MATIAGAFDPDGFAEFLVSQPDLGTKMTPRFVRVVPAMPVTATNKIQRATLRREGFRCPAPVWWRPPGKWAYRKFSAADLARLVTEYRARGAIARAMVVSEAAVGKHIGNILGKLDLPPAGDTHRRVLAVLAYLRG